MAGFALLGGLPLQRLAAQEPSALPVRLGVEELEAMEFAPLQGKRVGLVTNYGARTSDDRQTIDVLSKAPGVELVALFSPEHGLDGEAKAGKYVKDQTHEPTGLPIYSLYGPTRHPTPEMLEGLDVLVYDLQDIGSRSYTYISTLGYVMDAAREAGLEVVVLDRPNPLGGMRVEGARLDGISSFVGLYDMPFIYGLTPGELARWINDNYLEAPVDLTVVPMKGYRRDMTWAQTGLPWVPPSPKIPRLESAYGYAAIGFIGEIGISNGVMTDTPFEVINRGRVNGKRLAKEFNALGFEGVRLEPHTFISTVGRWKGSKHYGTRLTIEPRTRTHLPSVGYHVIELMRRQLNGWDPFAKTSENQRGLFDKVTGSANIRKAIGERMPVAEMTKSWREGEQAWRKERLPYLIYPEPRYRSLEEPVVVEQKEAASKPQLSDPVEELSQERFHIFEEEPTSPATLP